MLKSKKILIIDDDKEFVQEFLGKFLGQKDMKVFSAGDGEEGLEFLKSEKPDVVLLDIVMPKLDGIGFLKKLRYNSDGDLSDTAVFIITQLNDAKRVAETAQYNIKGYFIKNSSTFDQVISKIRQMK